MTTVTTDTAVKTIKDIQPLIKKIAAVFEAVNGAIDPDESIPAFMALYNSFKPLVKWLEREMGVPNGMIRCVKIAEWEYLGMTYCLVFTREEVQLYTNNWNYPEIGERAARIYLEIQKCDFSLVISCISDLLREAQTKLTDRAEKLQNRRERLAQVTALLSDATSEAERLTKPEVPLPPTTTVA